MTKMIISIIVIAIIVFLAIGFYNGSKLQSIHIQKTTEINADIETVFNNVVYLKNFPKWSPFFEADPKQITEVKGNDGQIGAQFHWNGNEGKDLGFQEIKEVKALEYIRMECDIQKPFKASPSFEYSFSQKGNKVIVTQDFKLKSALVDSFFMWLFGAKKDMANMNARGLELLKIASEK